MRHMTKPILCASLLFSVAACGDDSSAPGGNVDAGYDAGLPDAMPDAQVTFRECADSDSAFVRNAYLAILGRRPKSQAEVNVYVDLMAQTRQMADSGQVIDPREVVAEALFAGYGYREHWTDHFMSALKVPRIEEQNQFGCYGVAKRTVSIAEPIEGLAEYVRDNPATAGGDGKGAFNMRDLMNSALALDDISPLYRGHLFALVNLPIPAANVDEVEAELARREDFGNVFDATYLNRDMVCLACHNSESSVTFSDIPENNRHWALPGHLEKALFDSSDGIDSARAHAMFRYDGFTDGQQKPWNWQSSCGTFRATVSADPASVDGKFGPLTGNKLTVYQLEAMLKAGVDSLAANGLEVAADGSVAKPEQALAYLVGMSIVEGVWREVMGTPLTIANYFPRNQAARDTLKQLTDDFVRSHFSLRKLLIDIVKSDYFNRTPPEAGCGSQPYSMPAIFNPWVRDEADPNMRGNGYGDAVVPLSAETLLRTAYDALDWPRPAWWNFPTQAIDGVSPCTQMYTCPEMKNVCDNQGSCCSTYAVYCENQVPTLSPEEVFALQKGVGMFFKNGDRGFRGLDFQARLTYENAFGACENPGDGVDFVGSVLLRAEEKDVTLGDLIAAMKDRIIGQARVDHKGYDGGPSEQSQLESFFGKSLEDAVADVSDLEEKARAYCGVLLSSPQFMLSGMAPPDSSYVPILIDPNSSYDEVCEKLTSVPLPDLAISCEGGQLLLSPAAGP